MKSSALVSAPIPGQYIVVFKNNVLNATAMASSLALRHRTAIAHTYTSAIKGVALALSDSAAAAMRADPNVAYVEQDQTVTLTSMQTNAPWNLDRIDQRALPLSTTYTPNADGTGVTVYIMDSGINYAHVEFGGRAVPGADFVSPSLNGDDCVGHGTGVASIVGGATYGVAKNVRLVSLRVVDCSLNISSSRVIAAIDWIAAHPSSPSVVNMSMQLNKSTAVQQAIQNSINSGVVYAVAAGNTADDACNWTPANIPAVLTVAASDDTDGFASFSSYGSCVDIAAPGTGINTAWIGSTTAAHSGGGTSYSSPNVAGIAALYLQGNRSATPAQVSAAIISTATTNVLRNVPANTPNKLAYTGFTAVTNQPPIARFTVTCPTLQCTFDASTSTDDVGIASYKWTWGNGRGETRVSPVAKNTFASAGTYTVTLTVTDGSGQANSVSQAVKVPTSTNQAPIASITSPSNGAIAVQGASVAFAGAGSDQEDGALTGTSLTWTSSRDGQIGTGTSFSKTNLSVGSHVITLTARDAQGLTATATRSITITAAAPTNQAPVARFTWTCGAAGSRKCSVNGSASTDDVVVASYTWNWGNGRSETHVGSSASNTWTTSGTYDITLTVKDGSGLTGTVTRTVVVP
ncbi:MAG: S8 family serine peptidase [Gemmatimonadaceae bacterium]